MTAGILSKQDASEVNWSSYAGVYDLILAHNPAYQELIQYFERFLEQIDPRSVRTFLDIGAGTGNFSIRLGIVFPEARVIHLDADPAMNAQAVAKAEKAGLGRFEVVASPVEDFHWATAGAVDVVCMVHALYTMNDPRCVLNSIYRALRDGGWLFLCDLGRVMNLLDWSSYLARNLIGELGWRQTLTVFWRGREILRQNRCIRRKQLAGAYWVHSTEDLVNETRRAGFHVSQSFVAFRDYSDIVIARKDRSDERS